MPSKKVSLFTKMTRKKEAPATPSPVVTRSCQSSLQFTNRVRKHKRVTVTRSLQQVWWRVSDCPDDCCLVCQENYLVWWTRDGDTIIRMRMHASNENIHIRPAVIIKLSSLVMQARHEWPSKKPKQITRFAWTWQFFANEADFSSIYHLE